MALDEVHPLSVQLFNALPNLTLAFVVIGKIMLLSPVAKVTRYYKESIGVIEVGSEYLSIIIGHLLVHRATQNRHNFDISAKRLYDKRKMHLYAVLILLVIYIEHEKSLVAFEFVHNFNIHFQGSEGSIVLIHISQRASWEIFMVRRSYDKYSLYLVRTGYVLIGPSSSRSTVVQSRMRPNQRLYLLLSLLPLRVVYVLPQLRIEFRS